MGEPVGSTVGGGVVGLTDGESVGDSDSQRKALPQESVRKVPRQHSSWVAKREFLAVAVSWATFHSYGYESCRSKKGEGEN